MDELITQASEKMQKALDLLKSDIGTIRTGRATPSLVENVLVSVYGGSAKLKVMELATIANLDNQTLVLTPFDNTVINEIQKGITEANIGLNPVIDGTNIRISIPSLSQERREELIHLMKQKLENGRIMVRQIRHEAMNDIKKNESLSEDEVQRLEKEVQKTTDEFTASIEALGKKKEEELLSL